MSYSGLGKIRVVRAGESGIMTVVRGAPKAGTCSVGFPSRSGGASASGPEFTPWGTYPFTGSSKTWAEWQSGGWRMGNPFPAPWIDRAAEAGGTCGLRFFDAARSGHPRYYPFCDHDGDCIDSWDIPSGALSDEGYKKAKGETSLFYFVERRLRYALNGLLVPRDGFTTTLAAFAYDASFCFPVTVEWRFMAAVKRAVGVMESKYPASRWSSKKGAIKFDCGNCIRGLRRYKPASQDSLDTPVGPPCYVAALRSAPVVCNENGALLARPHSVGPHPTPMTPKGTRIDFIQERFIPLSALVGLWGDKLVASPWMDSLLNCLVPGWKTVAPPTLSKFGAKLVMMRLKK